MKASRFVIQLLIGLNLLLFLGLLVVSYDLPEAYAQSSAGGGKYIAVTAEYYDGTDALYILHAQKGLMSVITPQAGISGKMTVMAVRDVSGDLSN